MLSLYVMHVKQHPAAQWNGGRALFCAAILALSSACAQLVDLGGPTIGDDGAPRPGSGLPDRDPATSQGEGGPTSPAEACQADLSSDAQHCGFCNHTCGGAECRAGLCVPTVIVQVDDVQALAVSDDGVFFTTEHDVQGCPATPQAACRSLVDVGLVKLATAWGSSGGDVGASSGGGSPSPLSPRALALFGDRFYYADEKYESVISCPKTGCTTAAIASIHAYDADFEGGLAVDGRNVYWGDERGIGVAPLPPPGAHRDGTYLEDSAMRNVRRLEVGTVQGRDQLVFRGRDGVFAIGVERGDTSSDVHRGSIVRDFASDTQSVFVATSTSVVRVDRMTLARTTVLAVNDGEVSRLAADSNGVYAATSGNGGTTLQQLGAAGEVRRVATSPSVGAIALTASWLYYAGDGAIRRVHR